MLRDSPFYFVIYLNQPTSFIRQNINAESHTALGVLRMIELFVA